MESAIGHSWLVEKELPSTRTQGSYILDEVLQLCERPEVEPRSPALLLHHGLGLQEPFLQVLKLWRRRMVRAQCHPLSHGRLSFEKDLGLNGYEQISRVPRYDMELIW